MSGRRNRAREGRDITMSTQNDRFERYGELKTCVETDATYRVRDDGKMVALFGVGGEEFRIAIRVEDVDAIRADLGD